MANRINLRDSRATKIFLPLNGSFGWEGSFYFSRCTRDHHCFQKDYKSKQISSKEIVPIFEVLCIIKPN